ncbi:Splicing factor 3B subunit 1 [Hordeum vulgare]|nr:Splicing factor 3B subunit 1 [Hordeum vulgare]
MALPKVLKDKFYEKVINPYLAGVLQHPQSIEMREGVLHIRDVEGPKKTGSMEARLELMEQQVFKCQGMVERGLNAKHMMITEFTNKHKIDANDIGKHLSRLYDIIGHVQSQIYDLQNQNFLIREFKSPDEEMKKIVLKVVKQCASTEGVQADYIRSQCVISTQCLDPDCIRSHTVLSAFFKYFWVRRMALDRRTYKQLVETTVEMANKVGVTDIVGKIVEDLKDESEPYRRMVMETIEKVLANLGASDIGPRLEELLIDGILYAFQEQISDDANVMLNGFGAVVNALGQRVKPYLPQICGTIKWRLNNKSAKVRQQAADLISRIAIVMKQCQEEQLMGHLGVVLYEYLGEEYPEVLGSILGALKAIVNVIGMTKMTPPIKDLLPRLTPILKNRHEKVQENCIDLVGRIADRGAEFVPAREWMRICFELLEMLKARKKGIRRATVNTFGYIAKAIGPQDVLATLLNNLKVQERQNRVCTTVAIAIVAETCSPFTVLPALMNEYRVPELNIQNGVLKSLSFLFEYIGEMGKDYIYAVAPLLEDALMDWDLVHRQTAASAVKHMALGVVGLGCEDALVHLLNFVWPNIFETSPHLINAVMEAIEGMRVAPPSLRLSTLRLSLRLSTLRLSTLRLSTLRLSLHRLSLYLSTLRLSLRLSPLNRCLLLDGGGGAEVANDRVYRDNAKEPEGYKTNLSFTQLVMGPITDDLFTGSW